MPDIDFGLVLNLHQPAGNLDDLLEIRQWEAKEILWALDRIPRHEVIDARRRLKDAASACEADRQCRTARRPPCEREPRSPKHETRVSRSHGCSEAPWRRPLTHGCSITVEPRQSGR
jgi:hypothetical protein